MLASAEENILLWRKVLNIIEKEEHGEVISAWLNSLSIIQSDESGIIIGTYDNFSLNWVKEKYHSVIKRSLSSILGRDVNLSYKLTEKSHPEHEVIKADLKDISIPDSGYIILENSADKKEKKREYPFGSKYTFDNFVVGDSNRFSYASAIAISDAPAKIYNPFFIYGPAGLGKTHLLYSIANRMSKNFPHMKILCISSEKFTNMIIQAITKKKTEEFRQKLREIDALLIDDIHFIAGKEATQLEFFHRFNDLYNEQKQIVLTSDRPPKDIPQLEDRLISRFEWGLRTYIAPPDFETRVAILKKKMEKETVSVNDDIVHFIAENIKSNIRELEGALIRVVAFSSMTGKPITLDMAKQILEDSLIEEKRKITIDIIQEETAKYFNINVSDIRSKKRSKSIAYPRQIAMYLVRKLTQHSLNEIGEFFGGRGHTTVLHAISKIENEEKSNNNVKEIIRDITKNIDCR